MAVRHCRAIVRSCPLRIGTARNESCITRRLWNRAPSNPVCAVRRRLQRQRVNGIAGVRPIHSPERNRNRIRQTGTDGTFPENVCQTLALLLWPDSLASSQSISRTMSHSAETRANVSSNPMPTDSCTSTCSNTIAGFTPSRW